MKKIAGVIIVLALLVLAGYYITGMNVERTLNKNIGSIPKTPIFNVYLDQYQRGWFSSHARLGLKMHVPEQTVTDKNGVAKVDPAVDFDLNFPLTINHGPIIVTDNGLRFGMGQVTTQPQTHYGVLIDYYNNLLFKYTLPGFAIKGNVHVNDGDFQAEWLGLQSLLSVSANMDQLAGSSTIFGLDASAHNLVFKLGKISHVFKLNKNEDGLWLGDSQLSIPSIVVNAGDNNSFNLDDFALTSVSGIKEKMLYFNLDLSLKKVLVAGQNYGPGIFKFKIRNLDAKALADINQLGWQMAQKSQNPNVMMLSMLSELPKLISKGAEVELAEMALTLPEGIITGNFKISIPKSESSDLGQLMQKAYGEGQFKAPMTVVKSLLVTTIMSKKNDNLAQQQPTNPAITTALPASPASTTEPSTEDPKIQADKLLQDYVNKGILKIDGPDYLITIKLKNQQFMINGKIIDPSLLK